MQRGVTDLFAGLPKLIGAAPGMKVVLLRLGASSVRVLETLLERLNYALSCSGTGLSGFQKQQPRDNPDLRD